MVFSLSSVLLDKGSAAKGKVVWFLRLPGQFGLVDHFPSGLMGGEQNVGVRLSRGRVDVAPAFQCHFPGFLVDGFLGQVVEDTVVELTPNYLGTHVLLFD